MKKIVIFILTMALVLVFSSEVYAAKLTNSKSSWWSSQYNTTGFSHAGYTEVAGNTIWEGVMFYNSKTIYEYEVSDEISLFYVGTLYPQIKGQNYNVGVAIENILASYSSSQTFSITLSIGDMNMGAGIKKTYTDIITNSKIQQYEFNVKSVNMLNMTPLLGVTFDANNATIAVYAKTIRVREHVIGIRQTGPITNVYWTQNSYRVNEYSQILLDLNVLPITNSLKDSNYINYGGFYQNLLSDSVKGNYVGR